MTLKKLLRKTEIFTNEIAESKSFVFYVNNSFRVHFVTRYVWFRFFGILTKLRMF